MTRGTSSRRYPYHIVRKEGIVVSYDRHECNRQCEAEREDCTHATDQLQQKHLKYGLHPSATSIIREFFRLRSSSEPSHYWYVPCMHCPPESIRGCQSVYRSWTFPTEPRIDPSTTLVSFFFLMDFVKTSTVSREAETRHHWVAGFSIIGWSTGTICFRNGPHARFDHKCMIECIISCP